jgi:23S rRNA (uridine2552-2'-O)-methyltransferase
MPRDWRKQQSQDRYFRQAKADGYRARSAYKLQELNQRFRLLRPGAAVLDLGAAPGSWSQVAKQVVGGSGKVIAVDLQAIDPLPGVTTIQGDIGHPEVMEQMAAALPGGADVVLSDVSPAVSGIAISDHARSIALGEASLAVALRFLKPGGAFVVKVFQGEDFPGFVAAAKPHFAAVHVFNPQASRRESNERYVVGLGRKGLT